MSAEIIPFDFEEQAVRVIMRGDDPWFVAADVCRVLEVGSASQAVQRLDEDERGVDTIDTLGGAQRMTIINESGLYALVLTSRKEQAKKFRKWITAEVLPAIRRQGRYSLPGLNAEPVETGGDIAGLPLREAELWLQMVREARLTRGTAAASSLWDRSPLPPLRAVRGGVPVDPTEARACLSHLLADAAGAIAAARDGRSEEGSRALTAMGLRARADGLFVANYALDLFAATRWAGGAHRAVLLGLPGAGAAPVPLTLGGLVTRGVMIPWAIIDGEGV